MQRGTGCIAIASLFAVTANAAPPPATSLNSCQNAVRVESRKFVQNYVNAVGVCLQKVSTQIVQKHAASPAAAAGTCVAQFRRIYDSRGLGKSLGEKLVAKIAAKCLPGGSNTHTLQDILGSGAGVPQPLYAEDLNAWCSHFGGDGSVDTVGEWESCLSAAETCEARQAIATQYPRALEWLNLVRPSMVLFPSPAGDMSRSSDAVVGLDAAKAAIDGADDDGVAELSCGSSCGNGVKDGSEACDSADLGGATCTSLGFLGGTLTCAANCGFNTSACLTNLCGNGVRDGIESCDGSDMGGKTCATLGFVGGTLACAGNCQFNTTGCSITTCGNGVKQGNESCDGSDLGGATCTTLGYTKGGTLACTAGCGFNVSGCNSQRLPATGQTTCWSSSGAVISCLGTGYDGDVKAGGALAYVDNGDGTITDVNTGLVWEKLSDDGSIHDWDTWYTWGNAVAVKIATLNSTSFAGHNDWRLPNAKELQTIVNFQNVLPAVSAAFNNACAPGCTVATCSCTQSDVYWSSSTYQDLPSYAWIVYFYDGGVSAVAKAGGYSVRGVRGGL